MLTIAESSAFTSIRQVYWTEEELGAFCEFLARNPTAGAVIKGTDGCRKVRWSLPGKGKRGGVRVIYFNRLAQHTVWLLTMYSKNVAADIERKAVNKLRESINAKVNR